jgi:DNA repair exonuclease SbcCD nuclease subunit
MRIAHLSDTHLGYRRWHYSDPLGRNQREADVYAAFNEAVDKAISLKVDAVIHAGDLFETFHPTTYALGVALDGFARLRDAQIPSVVIAGNHSTPTRHSAAHVFSLLQRFGTHALFDIPAQVELGDLTVTGVPHHPDKEIMRQHIRDAQPDSRAEFNVLVLHIGLEGLPGAGSREVSAVELDPDALEEAAEFDYVALGHLHTFFKVGLNSCYAGSLERLGFYDNASEKGFALVDLTRAGRSGFIEQVPVQTRYCRLLPPVDVRGQEDIQGAIERALHGVPLKESVLRLPLVGVEQSAWRALDRRVLRELTKECLHFEPIVTYADAIEPPAGGHVDLHEFITERAAKELDLNQLISRAHGFMDRAAADLQQDDES